MASLDRILNKAVPLMESKNLFKKIIYPRVLPIGAVPFEVANIIRHTFKLPVQAAQSFLRIHPWIVSQMIDSKSLDEYLKALSSPFDILKTVKKIIACVMGLASSLTVGFIAPRANFKLHVALGLIVDHRALALQKKKQEGELLVKNQHREALKKQVEEEARKMEASLAA